MTEAHMYRSKAAGCLRDAERFTGTNQPDRIAALLRMADQWIALAEGAEREKASL